MKRQKWCLPVISTTRFLTTAVRPFGRLGAKNNGVDCYYPVIACDGCLYLATFEILTHGMAVVYTWLTTQCHSWCGNRLHDTSHRQVSGGCLLIGDFERYGNSSGIRTLIGYSLNDLDAVIFDRIRKYRPTHFATIRRLSPTHQRDESNVSLPAVLL